jgi:thiamine phosphate synthase YjbQ (UPF0047 family)
MYLLKNNLRLHILDLSALLIVQTMHDVLGMLQSIVFVELLVKLNTKQIIISTQIMQN